MQEITEMRSKHRGRASTSMLPALLIAGLLTYDASASFAYADTALPIPDGAISSLNDIHAEQLELNKSLPLKLDDQTTLLRVDFKKGAWNYHVIMSYYIYKAQEFADKRHATMMNKLCMDPKFVQYLKSSGPFLYQFTDPAGQVADVVFPKDDCGE